MTEHHVNSKKLSCISKINASIILYYHLMNLLLLVYGKLIAMRYVACESHVGRVNSWFIYLFLYLTSILYLLVPLLY